MARDGGMKPGFPIIAIGASAASVHRLPPRRRPVPPVESRSIHAGQQAARRFETMVLDRYAPAHVVLRLPLRSALSEAAETRRRAVRENVPVDIESGRQVIELSVEPLPDEPFKRQDALKLGADQVVVSKDPDDMAKHAGSFDFILDTVGASHDLDAYLVLLKRDATLCLVGAPELPHPAPTVFNLILGRKAIAGSLIGGLPEIQEMLDFCAEKGIVADIEMIRAQDIDDAYERMLKSDVKYRFVIDIACLAG